MKKLYYSIGEVNKITGIEPHVIRYWETIFPQLKPSKNRSGKRVFTQNDIKTILEIKDLVKNKGYSTSGAKKMLDEKNSTVNSEPINAELERDLKEVKLFLERMLEQL
ncbi:MAG: MerR family transcriptional regulator [Balneolaceae bacterium]|nr:MAG: MerR family transcriptional regulator [Balneolaceae bacterium]